MQIRVQVSADEGHPGVLDLHRWLSEDPDVTAAAEFGLNSEDAPGALGALDVIDVVLSNLLAVGSLLLSVATWREARARNAETHVEHNGVSVRIESSDPEHVRDVVRQLTEAADAGEPGNSAGTRPGGGAGTGPSAAAP